jgi:glucose-6-phosphate isomerase
LLGLIGVWNATFLQLRGHAVLPYDGRLASFPAFLTQLEMESNGKSVNRSGERLDYLTCPVLWGEIGANAQHAFYQLLHQGTQPVSADFIAPVKRYLQAGASLQSQHQLNLANCLAQSQVLAFGDECLLEPSALPHRRYYGNQPSTTLLLDELTPYSLGALVALYEHKVSVMAAIWDINPFDQWGVELGKQVANETALLLAGHATSDSADRSTEALVNHIRQLMSGDLCK